MYPEIYINGRDDFDNVGIPLLDAYNVAIKKKINTAVWLSLQIPRTSEQWNLIKKEEVIKSEGQLYIIKIISDGRDDSGKPWAKVEAKHIWWELCEKKHIPSAFFIGENATTILGNVFSGISYGQNNVRLMSDSEVTALGLEPLKLLTDILGMDKTNPLAVMSKVIDNLGGGEVYIDNLAFAFVVRIGNDKNITYSCSSNLNSLERVEETTKLVTRLYPYGKDSLEIDSVNGGVDYIDSPNINQYKYVHEGFIDYKDIEKPSALLQRAKREFADDNYNRIDKPKMAFKCNAVDLWKILGESNRADIGDSITIQDEQLGINENVRIVEYDYYPYEPQKSTVILGDPPKNINDILATMSGFQQYYNMIEPEAIDVEIELTENTQNFVTEVIKTDVLVADTAHILNCWIRNLTVEYFESNFDALDIRKPAPAGNMRNFIRIYGQNIQFYSADLSPTETENFITPDGQQVYYTAIGGEEDAYAYFTITDPVSIHPDAAKMNETQKEALREQYRVKVRQTLDLTLRMDMGFDETHQFKIPKMYWGSGDDNGNGRGFVYKDGDGMYLTYTLRVALGDIPAGTEIGIRITDEGAQYFDVKSNEWLPMGTGGGGGTVGNAVAFDHVPTQAEIEGYEEGTLIFVYSPA